MTVENILTVKGLDLLKIAKVDIKAFSSLQDLTEERPIQLLKVIREQNYKIPLPIEFIVNQLLFSSGDLWMAENRFISNGTFPYLYIGKNNDKLDLWINLYSKKHYTISDEFYFSYFDPIFKLYPA